MSEQTDPVRTLTSPEDIRAYFSQVGAVLGHMVAVTRKERQDAFRDALDQDVLLSYLSRFSATMRALAMKYGYSGYFSERLPSRLEISSGTSGLPTATEIRRLDGDAARALREALPEEDLRAEMVDFILREKEPPRDLQFRQSQSAYRGLLRDGGLFGCRVEPSLIEASAAPGGNHRGVLHWGTWDAALDRPLVYILDYEESGQRALGEAPDYMAALARACMSMSQSSLHPLTLATKLDEDFPTFHPKVLKRFLIGPLRSLRFTLVDPRVAGALEHVRDDWRLDWIMGWTVETLRSKGTRKVPGGFFSAERSLESFDVDPRSHVSVETGTTQRSTKVLLPYDVFQALPDGEANPFALIQKYVVSPDGHVASHL